MPKSIKVTLLLAAIVALFTAVVSANGKRYDNAVKAVVVEIATRNVGVSEIANGTHVITSFKTWGDLHVGDTIWIKPIGSHHHDEHDHEHHHSEFEFYEMQ